MTVRLFDYQERALAAEAEARRDHPDETRLLIQMATGLGKTVTFAEDARRFLESRRGNRVLILTHTDELAEQTEATVRLVAPAPWTVGVVKAGRDEVDADIVIGSVQTLADSARRAQLTGVGKIIVDEAHLSIAPTYMDIFQHYGAFTRRRTPGCVGGQEYCPGCPGGCWQIPKTPVTGYTATPRRGDGQSLGAVWQNLVFSRSTSWAVRHGFLANPRGYSVTVPEVGNLQTSDAAADRAIVDSIAPEKMVEAWLEHAAGRPTILFAPLVASAQEFAAAFRARGISAAVVWGEMPKTDRRQVIADYKAGKITVLCNAMALMAGFDAPATSCVCWCRSTGNPTSYVQGVGRGMRIDRTSDVPYAEQDAVILVLAGEGPSMNVLADLSDRPLEPQDGKSLTALEDEYDLSTDLTPDPTHAYAGAVAVSEFDPLVARSEKVWKKTKAGTLFVPAGKQAYVFLTPDRDGWAVAAVTQGHGHAEHRNVPDVELAMALAEDVAVDLGGDMGRLLADKDRPWRKGRPTADQVLLADRLGLTAEVDKIMATRASGKAGKVSDLCDRVLASKRIDPLVERIKQRVGR